MAEPLNCLIVEDSPSDAVLLIEALRDAGFDPTWRQVETEDDYRSGLETGPEIVLSDYNLPRFSGSDAIRILKESGREIPLILVTGTIGEERAVSALRDGATDYILKNHTERLGSAIRRARQEFRERASRRRAEETLRASEERFRQLADNINDVFWLAVPDEGQVLYLSPAFQKIWIGSTATPAAFPDSWPPQVHAEDREKAASFVTGAPKGGGGSETYRIVRPDGGVRWIHDRAFPVKDQNGKVTRIAGIAEDVTDQRLLADQLRQAQKMESIGQLAGGVAHDFNNLLTVIQGHASLMMSESDIPASYLESIEQIATAADRAGGLTRQLLAFSRKQEIRMEAADFNQVVGGVVRMLSRMLGEGVDIEVNCAEELPLVQADIGMLEQVLMNLAINARDAMPGGGRLIVATTLEEIGDEHRILSPDARPGTHVCLSVTDTGEGMTPETRIRIFEPFFTTKPEGKGTGLGLATVYGIVRQHGGWLNVYSEVGKGTVFRIYFPAAPAGSNDVAAPDPAHAPKSGTETLLLVEDEPALRSLGKCILEHYGYDILEAATGSEALSLWRQNPDRIRLALIDMIMPGGMNGWELARSLRRESGSLPIVFTSGYSSDVFPDETPVEKGSAFLQKPFTADRLARTVRRCLDEFGFPERPGSLRDGTKNRAGSP